MPFKQVQPVMAYAASHLDEDLSLRVLADHAGLSAFHLHRVFVSVAGETPKQYTMRLRLGRAAAMLLSSDDSVLEIALNCGFQNHESFTRAFRRQFQTSPSEYRRRGFTQDKSNAHAALIDCIGRCVSLYRMTEEKHPMGYSISKVELAPQPVLLVRHRVKRSEIAKAIGEGLPHIFMHAQKNGIALTGLPLTRYVDIGPGLLTIEPAMRVTANASSDGDVIADTLPGGPAAMTTHLGPYDKLVDAYGAIQEWIESQGLKPAGPPWECYMTDPTDVPDPKDWKTEVYWPLQM